MDGKKLTPFFIAGFVVLVVAASAGAYYLAISKPGKSSARNDIATTKDTASILSRYIGPSWSSYVAITEGVGDIKTAQIKFVLDGTVSLDTFNIRDAKGTSLFTVLVSTDGRYLDSDGKLQSVKLPVVVKIPSGESVVLLSSERREDGKWDTEALQAQLNRDPKRLLSGQRGRVIQVRYVNKFVFESSTDDSLYVDSTISHNIDTYNREHEKDVAVFLQKGTPPPEGFILPVRLISGEELLLTLP